MLVGLVSKKSQFAVVPPLSPLGTQGGKRDTYLFTLRSNVMYSGQYDPDPCVYGDALDILPNDYVKIVAVVDEYW